MYPKDTSSDDPGPAHPSEGGVQTESGMRRSIFREPSSSSTGSPSAAPLSTSDNPSPSNLNITVAPFTGGPFEVKVSKMDTVDELKKVIARRLKVSKERIYLLYRESELIEGSVSTNLLVDGSTVTLLPRAETGLISPKPEQSVMQALESLNEQQVNDFLSGAAPLNLTMRLGDHMMLIQLQLSTVNQASAASSSGSSSGSSRRQKSTIQFSSPPPYPTPPPSAPTSPSSDPSSSSSSSVSHSKKVRVPLLSPGGLYPAPPPACPASGSAHSLAGAGPVPQTIHRNYNPNQTQTPNKSDAFSRKSRSNRDSDSAAARGAPTPQAAGSESSGGEPPAKKPKLDTNALAEASKNLTQTLKQLSSEVLTTRTDSQETQPAPSTTTTSQIPKKETPSPSSSSSSSSSASSSSAGPSSASSGSGSGSGSERRHGRKRHSGRGAIIESMHHHGKGVYSGTFSGTLNPALQDEHGQPKRDITTIVHILNDLLCAQYKAYGGSGSGSSRSSKHHHRESKSSSQHSEAKSAVFDAEARAASEKQRQEEQVSVTRHKVEALRKIMEERKAKREARRQAKATSPASAASYSTAWSVSEAMEADPEAEHFLQQPEPVTA